MIKQAWKDVPYPGDSNIFTPNSYDDEDITEYFKGTSWLGHSTQNLSAHQTAISVFFTPVAYHYWLPAYLIAAVLEPEELDVGLEALVESFIPSEQKWFQDEQNLRMLLFTKEQILAVIRTIEYIAMESFRPEYPDEIRSEKKVLEFLYKYTNKA